MVLSEYISADLSSYKWDYAKKPTYEPKCVGEFSLLDASGKLELGRGQLKFLYEGLINRKLEINLTEGMDRQVEKWRSESLNKIFHWLMESNAAGTSLKEALDGCEIVCRRGPLTRIACAPYISRSPNDHRQTLLCVKYKGVLFIREYNKEEDGEDEKADWNDFQHKACFAGRKFEQMMTLDEPDEDAVPDTSVAVDPNPEFNRVFKSCLTVDGHPLDFLCVGEIDAIKAKDQTMVELKTQVKHIGHGRNFHYKAISWYLQSYFLGIDTLVVGTHENFVLNQVEYCSLDRIRVHCLKNGINPENCLRFLHTFLQAVKSELDAVPEGHLLVATRFKGTKLFTLEMLNAEEGKAEYTEVVSDEFRKHEWTDDDDDE